MEKKILVKRFLEVLLNEQRRKSNQILWGENNITLFEGLQVTIENFNSGKVLTYGTNPFRVYQKAIELGYKNPVLIYIPKSDEKFIL